MDFPGLKRRRFSRRTQESPEMRQLLFTGMIVLSFVQCFPDCVLEKGYSINADATSLRARSLFLFTKKRCLHFEPEN